MYACTYHIAGFPMVVTLPCEAAQSLMPEMVPFEKGEGGSAMTSSDKEAPVARVHVVFSNSPITMAAEATLLEESRNDMGEVRLFRARDGYKATISYGRGGGQALLSADADFGNATVELNPDSPMAARLLSSALRIVFSQAITFCQAVAMHASCVVADGKAYMFCGASGAGKSTHSRMWLEALPGTKLLNDDSPIVRIIPKGGIVACGSPWSGKTPIYVNDCAPLAALVRVIKDDDDRFIPLDGVEAYTSFLPSCSSLRSHGIFFSNVCDTLQEILCGVQAGIIRCTPRPEAAMTCHSALNRPFVRN